MSNFTKRTCRAFEIGLAISLIASLFFILKTRQEDQLVTELVRHVDSPDHRKVDDRVLAVAKEIFRRTNRRLPSSALSQYEYLEAHSPANVTAGLSLKYGMYVPEDHKKNGPCGTMSRVLLNALWKLDIPARKLHLTTPAETGGHTIVEYFDQGKWKVIAPSDYAFVWHNELGEIAAVSEIAADKSVLAQVYQVQPDFPYDFAAPIRFNWDRIPSPLQRVYRQLLGETAFQNAETPRLLDQPRRLAMFMSLGGSALCGLTVFFLQRKVAERVLRTIV